MLESADCGSLFAVLGDVGCVDGRDLSFWCSWLRRFFFGDVCVLVAVV